MPGKSSSFPAAPVERQASPENAAQATAKRGEGHEKTPAADGIAITDALHATYTRWSKMPLRLREDWRRLWWDLYVDRERDLDRLQEDIRVVCVHLLAQIERDKRNPGALRLSNLLQPDQFESEVAEARMMLGKRVPKSSRAAAAESDTPPPGWRAWLEDQYPQHAPDYRDKPFEALPGQLQRACRAALQ
jgi:hypothetical protein